MKTYSLKTAFKFKFPKNFLKVKNSANVGLILVNSAQMQGCNWSIQRQCRAAIG